MSTTDDHAAGRPADASGTFTLGGTLPVNRIGYGTMRLTGEGVWGEPADRTEAVRVLRRAVELGVNFIDTADSYGPFVSEQIIKEALYPYPKGLVIATKAGLTRSGPNDWRPLGRPEYLRQQVELSLRHLGLEHIDLFQLHRIDPQVPLADQVGELAAMRNEGKIGHVGLSKVTVEQVAEARAIVPIASVQNRYSLLDRASEDVLDYCSAEGIAFIPWAPVATGDLARAGGPLDEAAKQHNATPSQLALAWLLHRSPVMLPIPGTSKTAHVEENTYASRVKLEEGLSALSVLSATTARSATRPDGSPIGSPPRPSPTVTPTPATGAASCSVPPAEDSCCTNDSPPRCTPPRTTCWRRWARWSATHSPGYSSGSQMAQPQP